MARKDMLSWAVRLPTLDFGALTLAVLEQGELIRQLFWKSGNESELELWYRRALPTIHFRDPSNSTVELSDSLLDFLLFTVCQRIEIHKQTRTRHVLPPGFDDPPKLHLRFLRRYCTMKFSTSSILLAASSLLGAAVAHNIQLAAHGRECFHEMLHKDDKMTVTFQVGDREFGSAGNLHVDFWIQNPSGGYEAHERSVSNGDHSFTAQHDGKFVYCFSNEHWSASSKDVSFNVHGIVYVPEAEAPSDPLEAEVRQLSELLAQVKDEQSYIVVRERTHRNTAESTNARVKWWSIFQMGVLAAEGIFQVWWLKRFFEVKRVV